MYEQGEKLRRFRLSFGGLAQCGFRVRLPLSAVDQSRWLIDREGAYRSRWSAAIAWTSRRSTA